MILMYHGYSVHVRNLLRNVLFRPLTGLLSGQLKRLFLLPCVLAGPRRRSVATSAAGTAPCLLPYQPQRSLPQWGKALPAQQREGMAGSAHPPTPTSSFTAAATEATETGRGWWVLLLLPPCSTFLLPAFREQLCVPGQTSVLRVCLSCKPSPPLSFYF